MDQATATPLPAAPDASGAPWLLEVDNLHVEFRTSRGVVRAVEGISYQVRAGEVVALVGESGCGKSVSSLAIMRLLAQTGRVTRGRVLFGGRDLLTLAADEMRAIRGRDIAMIFQDPMTSLNPVLTIGRQLVEVLRRHQKLDGVAARHRAVELLEMVGIPLAEKRLGAYPHQFSGGMRQRVMIAMALACRPALLIAEIGNNHNGSFERAIEMIDKAHDAGAESCDGTGWFRGDRKQLDGLEKYLDESTNRKQQMDLMLN